MNQADPRIAGSPTLTEAERLERRLQRERRARREAEVIAEAATRELYDRKRILEVLESVAADANSASAIDTLLGSVLDRVCAFTGWSLGHVYLVDESGVLRPAPVWHAPDPERVRPLIDATARASFRPGEGLPGRVLASGEPVWVVDVATDPRFPRAEAATASAVRSAFGLPIVGAHGACLGALEFFAIEPLQPDARLEAMLRQIGEHVGVVVERERARADLARRTAELEAANDELQEFAYVASHDLSEPLRTISGFIELLKNRYGGKLDAEADEFIDFAIDGAQRMQRLIRDLLAYSQVGQAELDVDDVDLNEVVAETWHLLGASVEDAGATLAVGELPTVRGDRVQLSRLFSNLLSNAVKFRGHDPPLVTVSAEPSAGGLEFTVADNGIGIDPRHAERVFKVFGRLHGVGEYPGTGIGLSICKRIVERHGGTISIESAEPEGTVFRFDLVGQPDGGA